MLSPAELLLLAEELNGALAGARLQKLHGRSALLFVLEAWGAGGGRLAVSLALDPAFPRVVLCDTPGENPAHPPGIVTELRELLLNARIESVTSVMHQRILVISLQTLVEGAAQERRLVVELFGRAPRLIVMDHAGVILASHAADLSKTPRTAKGAVWVPPLFEHAKQPPPTEPFAFLPVPLPRPLSLAVEAHARAVVAAGGEQSVRSTVARLAEKLLRKEEQLLEKLQRVETQASEAAAMRRDALLLQQQLSSVPRNAISVELVDPTAPDSPPRTLVLNPRLGPVGMLQKLFKDAQSREATWARASAKIGFAADKVVALQDLLRRAEDQNQDLEDLRARAAALDCAPPAPNKAAVRRKAPAARLPYRTFVSRDGIEILVGRTAADNDVLTFDVARKNELWLHVGDHPGSHVVVRCVDEVPEQTLLDAAALAAHFSRCGKGAKPEVSWTRVKHVRKFTGAKPGQVQLADRRSLRVRGEPERLARLMQSEQRPSDAP
ncbi:MAG: DUF814 domain-containing protein [Planctomycetes bacterium]|nr:DUF814 domain-containing protein [Planctomycetota bacterium]